MWDKLKKPDIRDILHRAWITWRYFIPFLAASYVAMSLYPSDWVAVPLVVLNVGIGITVSNVVHIALRRNMPCIGICGYTTAVQGEAIPVGLSNGKYLFVLLGVADHSFRSGNMPYQAFRPLPPYRKISELPRNPLNVPPKYVPTIIYFADMADPESAVIANQDNFQTLVGENVRLMNVSVKLTDDHVSTGIDHLLPWVKKQEVVQKSNENISTSHFRYPETDSKSKPLQSDYPRFLERNDW